MLLQFLNHGCEITLKDILSECDIQISEHQKGSARSAARLVDVTVGLMKWNSFICL